MYIKHQIQCRFGSRGNISRNVKGGTVGPGWMMDQKIPQSFCDIQTATCFLLLQAMLAKPERKNDQENKPSAVRL